jgi:hypothetical protein
MKGWWFKYGVFKLQCCEHDYKSKLAEASSLLALALHSNVVKTMNLGMIIRNQNCIFEEMMSVVSFV